MFKVISTWALPPKWGTTGSGNTMLRVLVDDYNFDVLRWYLLEHSHPSGEQQGGDTVPTAGAQLI